MHHSAWPAQNSRPFHEAVEASSLKRGEDRVEFSDELRRLNAEQRLRRLGCEAEPHSTDIQQTAERAEPARPTAARPDDAPEHRPVVEHRYEVTHRSTTGRLIDMLM